MTNLIKNRTLIDKKEFYIDKEIVSWYEGPKSFNLFYMEFGDQFCKKVDDIIEPKKRIKSSLDDLICLGFEDDKVDEYLNGLIGVVNYSSRPKISDMRKKRYKNYLRLIARDMVRYRTKMGWDKGSKDELIVVPLRGGGYLFEFLDNRDRFTNVLAIDCKRIPIKTSHLYGCFDYGMRIDKSNKFLLNNEKNLVSVLRSYKYLRIVEMCTVSGMTTIGFLTFLKNIGLEFKEIEIDTIALSQQGYEAVKKYLMDNNVKSRIRFLTGGLYYRLGDYYKSHKDELLTLDEKLVVGDVKSFIDDIIK